MNKQRKIANDLIPASATHPGVLLKDEILSRGMKQIELADKIGVAKNVMSELISGKRNITADIAVRLEAALEIDAEFWMKYQAAYDIDKVRIKNKKKLSKTVVSKSKSRSSVH